MSAPSSRHSSARTRLIRGMAVLGIAAVLSKALGTLQKIPLQNVAGDGVFGIYNAVYPLYTLILITATAGLPIAVSARVAEAARAGDERETQRVLHMAAVLLSVSGLAGWAILYFGAPLLAAAIGSAQTEPAIRSVSFALLLVPLLAALRGYYQGRDELAPTGLSQVVEQLVRVMTIFGLLFYSMSREAADSEIAAGAMFGSVTGAAAALLLMLGLRVRERRRRMRTAAAAAPESAPAARERRRLFHGARAFLGSAAAVSIGLLVLPVMNLADVMSVPRLLAAGGWEESEAMAAFGVYTRSLPLVQLVGMLATTLTAVIVPAAADAYRSGDRDTLRRQVRTGTAAAWAIGLAASAGMAALAEPLNVMFYTDNRGSTAFALLAWTNVTGVGFIVTAALLQGIGAERMPMLHILIGVAVKIGLNAALIPACGLQGAAWAAIAGYAAAFLLNLAALRRRTGEWPLAGEAIGKTVLAAAVMTAAVAALRFGAAGWNGAEASADRGFCTAISLTGVMAGAAVFAAAVWRLRLSALFAVRDGLKLNKDRRGETG